MYENEPRNVLYLERGGWGTGADGGTGQMGETGADGRKLRRRNSLRWRCDCTEKKLSTSIFKTRLKH